MTLLPRRFRNPRGAEVLAVAIVWMGTGCAGTGVGKRKLNRAEKAAKKKRRQEYETIFINGKMKRVRRPPTIEGMNVDDFIRQNADPIFLQEKLWECLEPANDARPFSIGSTRPHKDKGFTVNRENKS